MNGIVPTAVIAAFVTGATGVLLVILIGFWRELRMPGSGLALRLLPRRLRYVRSPVTHEREFLTRKTYWSPS